MPYYYGIDLGTTNTVISCLRVFPRRWAIMTPNESCSLEDVPIYYDKYSWDPRSGRYLDYNETIYNMQQGGITLNDMFGDDRLTLEWPKSLPSVVYQHFPAPGVEPTYLTGKPAINMYDQEHNRFPERFFENTKVLMDQDLLYEDGSLTAVDIAKQLLRTCFLSIMKYIEKEPLKIPSALGISYPAARNQMNYLKSLRDAAVEAAREVGLIGNDTAIDFFCTTQEPYAAMMSAILDDCKLLNAGGVGAQIIRKDSDDCLNLMVVDIGGGTTDIAIQPVQMYRWSSAHMPVYPEECLRMNANRIGGFHSTSSAVNLNGDFGGADFDYMLARKIARRLAEQANIDLDIDHMSPYIQGKALKAAQEMKHDFANDADKKEWKQFVTAFFGPLDHMHDTTLQVQRDKYEEWIRPYIRNTVGFYDPHSDYKRMRDDTIYSIERIIDNTMRQAGCVDWNDIDFIFLTGGMSKMPEIRKMLNEKVRNTRCRIIFSDERRQVAVAKDADSPRFKDITYGVAVYACLTGGSDSGNVEVPNHGGKRLKDFTTSPHSSVALLADVGEGLPVVLINHSQALPVEDNIVPNVFTSQDTAGISVQMYTGLSAYDKGLKKLTRNFVSLEKHPPFVGTQISLIYSIGQDMQATLRVRYTDAMNQTRTEPMRQEVNLDSVRRTE